MKCLIGVIATVFIALSLFACGGGGGGDSSFQYGGSIQDGALDSGGVVTTLAGSDSGVWGSDDGTGADATFDRPYGITTDGTNLYVADRNNNIIRKVAIATGVVTTIAGDGSYGGTDGTGTAAQFSEPYGITTDGTNLYVVGRGHTIRQIVIATGVVTTIAGSSGVSGSDDGTGTAARFNRPYDITTDGTNLYVADRENNLIRQMVIATGVVTTIAGDLTCIPEVSPYPDCSADGTGTAAQFYSPRGLTVVGGDLYVTDWDNYTIRKIVIATGVVTTFAGDGTNGALDGIGTAAQFYEPRGITSDGTNLFVADYYNLSIRQIVIATAEVTTLAGGTWGDADGTGAAAYFAYPTGITTDGISLFVTDGDDGSSGNHTIREIN
jgi:hypothetical protein